MVKITLIFFTLCFSVVSCSSSSTPLSDSGEHDLSTDLAETEVVSENVFSLLTYNVAGLPEGLSSSDPAVFIPLISPMLNAYDVVLAQEDFWYHLELIKDVDHPYVSSPVLTEPSLTEMGDGLNRFSRFPFEELKRIQWVQCHGHLDCSNDCLAEKGFSVARTDLGQGALVDIYNLHMEAGGCPEDIESRAAGVEQLIDYINLNSDDVAIIVAGDFNLREGDPTDLPLIEKLVSELSLTDACIQVECGDLRIDKVYYRNTDSLQLEALSWSIPPEFVSVDGVDLSDHEPVKVDIRWHQMSASD